MSERKPVEVFPPGEFIRDEIEARRWSQEMLAYRLGYSLRTVKDTIAGKRQITPKMAERLGRVFGTSAELWLNLERNYQKERPNEA